MTEEKHEHLLKETWSNIKLATILVFALMIIFALGYFFSELADEVNIWKGVIFWVIMSIASIGWAVLVLFVIREYKIDAFRKWGDTWMENADKSLKHLQTSEIINNKIAINSFGIIKEFNSVYKKCQEENKEVQELNFLGSMVGFSKFLPKPISNHYCENKNDLVIKIIASNVVLGAGKYRLWLYPSKFIISILSDTLSENNFNGNLQFEIYPFAIDFPSALFIIGDYKSINTQSLGSEAWDIPDNSNFEIIGTIYKNDGDTKEEFQRSQKSIENIISDYEKNSYPIEKWSIRKSNGIIKLSIKDLAKWSINSKTEVFCEGDDDYDFTKNSKDIDGIDNIKEFVETFKKKLIDNKGIH